MDYVLYTETMRYKEIGIIDKKETAGVYLAYFNIRYLSFFNRKSKETNKS